MRVLFIVPPNYIGRREISRSWTMPSLGIASIAAFLREKKVRVQVIDLQVEHFTLRQLEEKIAALRPDVVGITALTQQIVYAGNIAKMIKEANPKIYTVLGGVHATALPKETLRKFEYFDIIVYGEGELTMYELITKLESGGDLSKVKGIAYRNGKIIEMTEPRPLITELDDLPFPDWDLFHLNRYRSPYSYVQGRIRVLPVQTKRGCPYHCIFCCSAGHAPRMRSIDNIIDEIERNIAIFKVGRIYFIDETFTIDYERTMRLCDKMIEKGINKKISWGCAARVDLVDKNLLKKIKEANCKHIDFGIESGNQQILNIIKKGITLKQAREAFTWTKEVGIKASANFILGHPFETLKTAIETIRFAWHLNPDYVIFSTLVPYPGTELMKMVEEGIGGLRIETLDWTKYDKQIGNVLSLKQLNRTVLDQLRRTGYLKFYLRPSRFLNAFHILDIRALPIFAFRMGYLKFHFRPRRG